MPSSICQHLLERVSSLLRTELRQELLEHGLQPVQFEALNYLAMANRYSDTPMAVTEFLGQTKGTVSQTLNVLEREGLISKVPDANDKRVVHLKVSRKGEKLVNRLFPSKLFDRAWTALGKQSEDVLQETLTELLRTMQAVNGYTTFGQCKTCVHNKKINEDESWCRLTEEPLSAHDVELICREHKPATV